MKSIILWLVLILCSIFLFDGCSLLGYGLGLEFVDSAKLPDPEPITFEELNMGQRVKIEIYGGDVIEGTYLGVRENGSEEELFLLIFMGKSRAQVPYESIEQIYEIGKQRVAGRVLGFLIGFGIDMYLFHKLILKNLSLFSGFEWEWR